MQVAFYFAGEITQVLDANPWVRCASGNVYLSGKGDHQRIQVPMAGEGLYAKTEISEGQLLAFYNGVRVRYTRC